MKHLQRYQTQKTLRLRLAEQRPRLYRLAYSWCHDAGLSDDLTQEALAKALLKLDQLRDPALLDKWLNGILVNCWRDHFRTRKEHERIDDFQYLHEDTPDARWERDHQRARVQQAIARLPEAQRMVLTLVDMEGASYADVAEILEIPIGTVMSRLCRARKTLLGWLDDMEHSVERAGAPYIRRIK